MKKHVADIMNRTATYYPQTEQELKIDAETNARFWSIAGSNLQFTWFEVLPGTLFKEHTHESEQVTHVLSGELFFRVEGEVYRLGGGDSIIIPGNKKHTVWTEDIKTIAVDAWSPVNKKYNS